MKIKSKYVHRKGYKIQIVKGEKLNRQNFQDCAGIAVKNLFCVASENLINKPNSYILLTYS
mgnify:CR=1 FL=1